MNALATTTYYSDANNPGFHLFYPNALPNYGPQALTNDKQYASKCSRTSLPLDAPIQSRTYVTPSATSRKALPAYFAKTLGTAEQKCGKRHRGSVHDALRDGTLSLTPEQLNKIEARRNRNAFSARLSRKRKAELLADLERQRDEVQEHNHTLRDRIAQLESTLRAHNIRVPSQQRSFAGQ